MSISAEEKNHYLREAAIVLAREGFHTDRTHAGGLRVLLDGAPLCEVTENGGITYRYGSLPALLGVVKAIYWRNNFVGRIVEIARLGAGGGYSGVSGREKRL